MYIWKVVYILTNKRNKKKSFSNYGEKINTFCVVRKWSSCNMRTVLLQISLRIRAVWSESYTFRYSWSHWLTNKRNEKKSFSNYGEKINTQCSSRSAYASAQSDLRATRSVILGLIDLKADSVSFRSDGGDVQADLELHCPHMSEGTFSRDVKAYRIPINYDKTWHYERSVHSNVCLHYPNVLLTLYSIYTPK